jgi:hypothetical protein
MNGRRCGTSRLWSVSDYGDANTSAARGDLIVHWQLQGAQPEGGPPLLFSAAWSAVLRYAWYQQELLLFPFPLRQCCVAGGCPPLHLLCGGGGAAGHRVPHTGLLWRPTRVL